jgi:hypothetical protein
VLLLGVTGTVAGCGSSTPYAGYCSEVKAQQQALTEATAQGAATGLLAALPSFRALQAKAPSDIADDWTLLVHQVEQLQTALTAAGVDPSTYDPATPPAGLSAAQRTAITTAATGLASPDVVSAFTAVQQEARDVCQTPLTL